MRDVFYIISYSYFICVGILLCGMTLFYPGGYSELKRSLTNPYTGFLPAHILMALSVLAVFMLFLFMVGFVFGKWVPLRERLKFYSKAFLVLGAISTVLVMVNYMLYS